eukprot:324990-Amphidinium_carterae.1
MCRPPQQIRKHICGRPLEPYEVGRWVSGMVEPSWTCVVISLERRLVLESTTLAAAESMSYHCHSTIKTALGGSDAEMFSKVGAQMMGAACSNTCVNDSCPQTDRARAPTQSVCHDNTNGDPCKTSMLPKIHLFYTSTFLLTTLQRA